MNDPQLLTLLVNASFLVEHRERFRVGGIAEDVNGKPLGLDKPGAFRYSLRGALNCVGLADARVVGPALTFLAESKGMRRDLFLEWLETASYEDSTNLLEIAVRSLEQTETEKIAEDEPDQIDAAEIDAPLKTGKGKSK